MMVDMGNSAIKWAVFEAGQLFPMQRMSYQKCTLDHLLTQIWGTLKAPSVGVWVSNVAGPQKAEHLTHWVKHHWNVPIRFVETSEYAYGIKNAYDNPKQLGIDRWLALIGAYHVQEGALCVVDCGTAITVDVLSAKGHHQGGLIIPGLTTMYNALLSDTYALDKMGYQCHEDTFLAYDTESGITLGTRYAIIGLLEYVMNQLEHKTRLILTGGSTPVIASLLHIPYQHIPELVLLGLKTVAIENTINDRFTKKYDNR